MKNIICKARNKTSTIVNWRRPKSIVIIEGHECNRNHWTIGIVGRDGVTRAANVWTGKSTLERAIQQLYLLELRFDNKSQDQIEIIDDIKSKHQGMPLR